ncbi:hypothetical protein [Nocardia sp. NPDC050435]|uniref:hypothetical protein n=1 Tax=Nocardia sp. NPDC050435 TaxID=3155040 RepID=UPI0033D1D118
MTTTENPTDTRYLVEITGSGSATGTQAWAQPGIHQVRAGTRAEAYELARTELAALGLDNDTPVSVRIVAVSPVHEFHGTTADVYAAVWDWHNAPVVSADVLISRLAATMPGDVIKAAAAVIADAEQHR